ncbi:MAG: hypothetical protein HGA45_34390, partial [Chloroflexales bacterium]|nr:hypothetical protein [Chloroflexales bacterium]
VAGAPRRGEAEGGPAHARGQGGEHQQQRAYVWVVFAAPCALFLGWLAARRRELGLAAFCCFCLYFFTFFVAQRIETLVVSPEAAAASGHALYFSLAIAIHAVAGAGLAVWRALAPAPEAPLAPAAGEG